MKKTTNINIRVNPDIKAEADAILSYLGMTTSEAVTIFLRQVIINKGLPFDVKVPKFNSVTLEAIEEAKQIAEEGKGYDNMEDMLKELRS